MRAAAGVLLGQKIPDALPSEVAPLMVRAAMLLDTAGLDAEFVAKIPALSKCKVVKGLRDKVGCVAAYGCEFHDEMHPWAANVGAGGESCDDGLKGAGIWLPKRGMVFDAEAGLNTHYLLHEMFHWIEDQMVLPCRPSEAFDLWDALVISEWEVAQRLPEHVNTMLKGYYLQTPHEWFAEVMAYHTERNKLAAETAPGTVAFGEMLISGVLHG